MGKTKEQHEQEIAQIIERDKIMFISHIFGSYHDLGRSQFYNLELDKSHSIKEAIDRNRSKATGFLVNKWIASDNPTLQIAAYRLTCTEDERRMLNQAYVDHTTKGEEIKQEPLRIEVIDRRQDVIKE